MPPCFSPCPENNRRYDPGGKGSPSNDFQNSHALKSRLRNLGIVPMRHQVIMPCLISCVLMLRVIPRAAAFGQRHSAKYEPGKYQQTAQGRKRTLFPQLTHRIPEDSRSHQDSRDHEIRHQISPPERSRLYRFKLFSNCNLKTPYLSPVTCHLSLCCRRGSADKQCLSLRARCCWRTRSLRAGCGRGTRPYGLPPALAARRALTMGLASRSTLLPSVVMWIW